MYLPTHGFYIFLETSFVFEGKLYFHYICVHCFQNKFPPEGVLTPMLYFDLGLQRSDRWHLIHKMWISQTLKNFKDRL